MDYRARPRCYPRGSFYPLSSVLTTKQRRITKTEFPPCSACPPHSQAGFYAFVRPARFPSVLSRPLYACVTLEQATSPVKLPTRHCSILRFQEELVRVMVYEERYFTNASPAGREKTPRIQTSKTPNKLKCSKLKFKIFNF